jgi:hypothetical protein
MTPLIMMDEIRLGTMDDISLGSVDVASFDDRFCHLDDRCLGRCPYFGEMRGGVPRLTRLIFIFFGN